MRLRSCTWGQSAITSCSLSVVYHLRPVSGVYLTDWANSTVGHPVSSYRSTTTIPTLVKRRRQNVLRHSYCQSTVHRRAEQAPVAARLARLWWPREGAPPASQYLATTRYSTSRRSHQSAASAQQLQQLATATAATPSRPG